MFSDLAEISRLEEEENAEDNAGENFHDCGRSLYRYFYDFSCGYYGPIRTAHWSRL